MKKDLHIPEPRAKDEELWNLGLKLSFSQTFAPVVGQRFGRLVVANQDCSDSTKWAQWLCVCDCGQQINITQSVFRHFATKLDCGCGLAKIRSRWREAQRLSGGPI